MEPGDLITTPSWNWHDHVNSGDTPIIWLDGADGPMLHYYQAGFANPFHERQQTVSKPEDWSKKTYGALRPQSTPKPTSSHYRPPYRYSWKDTEEIFAAMAGARRSLRRSFAALRIRSAAGRLADDGAAINRPGENPHRHTHSSRTTLSRLGHDLDQR
jgi:hypothetical protein